MWQLSALHHSVPTRPPFHTHVHKHHLTTHKHTRARTPVPAEREAWQAPPKGAAISERGKALAAEELARTQLAAVRGRGCRETFDPDPALLAQGLFDVLPAAPLT